jgi:hypothetical protein
MPRLRSLATGVVVNLSDEQVAAGLTGFAPVDSPAAEKAVATAEKKAAAAKPTRVKASTDDKD